MTGRESEQEPYNKKHEERISNEIDKDQSIFETEIFAGRRFSKIQKYLRANRKSPSTPPLVNYASRSARLQLSSLEGKT